MKICLRSLLYIIFLFTTRCCVAQTWLGFNSGTDDAITRIYNDSINSLLYVGGKFTNIGGFNSRGIAVWNGNYWDSLQSGIDLNLSNHPQQINSIINFQNKIFIGGAFNKTGNVESKYFNSWNGQSWDTTNSKFNGPVLNFNKYNGELYACGTFDTIDSTHYNGLAKWNGSIWSDVNNFPHLGFVSSTNGSIEFYNGKIYIGGNFEGDSGRKEITYWNDTNWISLNNGILGLDAWVNCLKVYKNELYVGGYFTKSDGNAGNSIMRWNGLAWSDVGNGIGGLGYPQVESMLVYNNELYVTGIFSTAGNLPCSNIARWNGTQWCSLFGEFNNIIMTINDYDNNLFVGGGFNKIDNDSILGISFSPFSNIIDSCEILVIIDPNLIQFEIRPNPAGTKIEIISNSNQKCKVSVCNCYGQILSKQEFTGRNNSVNVSNLSSGLYLLIFKIGNSSFIKKFIKE